MLQVIDIANLIVAAVALIVSGIALVSAKSLQNRSITSEFVLGKYFDVHELLINFSNDHKFKENAPPAAYMTLARGLQPYRTVLSASGLNAEYKSLSNALYDFEKRINQKGAELMQQGLTHEQIAVSLGTTIDELAGKLRAAIEALDGGVEKRISVLINDPLLSIKKI